MKRKLNGVLLIDDDEAINFLHKMVLKKANCAERVLAVQSGAEALDFLRSTINGEHPQPDLIFLDINMPAMNGWEFLEHYRQLKENQKGRVVVVMLTTSLNPEDKELAQSNDGINDFLNKPLTVKMVQDIIEKHFPELID